MRCTLTCVDDLLNRAFHKIGLVVGRHPGYFVIVPVLLACICITGYQKIHYEIDPEYLFSPINGPGKYERAIVEKYFKVNYSHHFDVGRITRPGRFGHVIIIPKDGDSNMLRKVVWDELQLLDNVIKNATATYEGESFTYEQVCARWQDQCFNNDILSLHHVIAEVESRELNLTFPLMLNPVTWDTHLFPVYFGGSVITEDMTIETVPSVQLAYFIAADNKRQDAIGAAWEEAFLDAVGNAEDSGLFKHISTARFASRTLELELEANTKTVVPYFSSTFAIMGLFSVVTCMMADWVRSKPWLGLLGNISAAMATVSAFGMCMYIGIDFIGINLAAPFLMIGIGIDDTFVMLAAWRRTNILSPVPERMAATLSEAAVSITITSLTDMISFFIGIMSPFPSVQIFCIYSGFAVVFTFLFHLSFFSGCVAISGYCEQKNLHSIVCCKVQPVSKSTHRSWLYRLLCTGGVDPDDPDNPLDNPEHGCMTWFRDYLAVALNYWLVKVLVIITFGLYLAGALYGLTTLQEGLDRRKLSKEDSYSVTFYDREDFYFREFPYRIQVVVSGAYDYSDPEIQNQMENLTRTLEETSYISSPIYTESWIRGFLSYVRRNEEVVNGTIDNEEDFVKTLKDFWLFPSSTYSLDVKFDPTGEHIIASRFLIQAVNISGTNHEKEMVKELRRICHDSPLNASVFHPYFVFFDQFELVRPTSIQCMIFGALIMMLISFIFIPNILCCLWVAFCIVSIELGVAGYMALWDVNLDSISMINLIMCIGFSVDFTAHICYAYMSSKKKKPEDRVKECLYNLGLPIVQGAASTILGLVALLLAGTYIFLVFFKMVFLVIFIGAMHGLFLLPVLLSIFGPGSCSKSNDEEVTQEEDTKESKLQQPYVIPHPTLIYHQHRLGKSLQGSPTTSLAAFEERDPGIGTSEDSNSTESSSSQSRRRQVIEREEIQQQFPNWRRSVGILQSLSQFQNNTAPPPDYPGASVDQPRNFDYREYRIDPHMNQIPGINNDHRDYRRSRSHHSLHPSGKYLPDSRYG
ncbi:patched domain-containing protein 3 [Cephus cinctus]|uniref:Patched domain-containing protein 3 n=1 Tax=Cephus cinctus TaxID=211228 RepID=A0AAJ7RR73_CEPCN|nr:patched domain-containing protein 3 [Cephus cinctus]XP_015605308.1 patched domain-containing protein 3 [Cephus cinctus]XP_024945610.1 patched domain-containing protein 3 [Cephus cinctus]